MSRDACRGLRVDYADAGYKAVRLTSPRVGRGEYITRSQLPRTVGYLRLAATRRYQRDRYTGVE